MDMHFMSPLGKLIDEPLRKPLGAAVKGISLADQGNLHGV
jgi:hypothetical protein